MSERNGFVVECGPADSNGKRVITALFGKVQHRDKFDPADSFKRSKFREQVIERFQWDDSAHESLEQKILAAAEAADSDGAFVECATVRMSDVAAEQVEWLWRERFAIGKLTLLVGDPGQGKSFLTLDIAARVSRGAPWPDNRWEPQQPGDVVLLTAEDDLSDTIRPRLDALEADCNRIIAIRGAKFVDEEQERMVNLSTDLQSIRAVIQSANNPRAIVIDPVSAYLGRVDSHNNAEVRGVLAPLAELAAETRVAVIAVSHLRKGEGAAMYRTMGSLAFIAAARSAWVVAKDEADHSRRLMLPIKSNIAPDVGGLAFAIQPHGPNGAPVVCWEAEPISVRADDAIGHGQRKHGPPADERTEASDWLRQQLSHGPRPKKEIIDEGGGYGFRPRTLERAFREIGGHSKQAGFPAVATWSISSASSLASDDSPTNPGEPGEPGETVKNPHKTTTYSLFLRNGSAVPPSSEGVANLDQFADFEAARIEAANGSDSPWF